MITIILFIFISFYFVELLFFRVGLAKADRISVVKNFEPTVSVIVAARNEERVISDCIDSLLHIDYPKEKLEIIIVNDHSTDKTAEIIMAFKQKHPMLKMITSKPPDGNLRGKTNAVAQGINVSTGEILMFTDADCRVQPSWVHETVKYFDDKTGVVGGYTLLDVQRTFEGIQSLDWIFLFGLASATASWNIPLTVIGNNLSLRRAAYDQAGGYNKIQFSVTEDYALVQAVLQKTKYRINFPINYGALVFSGACRNWNQLYRQKQRWGVGGLDMVFRGLIIMAIGWTAKLCLLIGLFSMNFIALLIAVLLMLTGEFMFIFKPLSRFKATKYLKYFPIFFLYLFIYALYIPFLAFFSKRVIWKERSL